MTKLKVPSGVVLAVTIVFIGFLGLMASQPRYGALSAFAYDGKDDFSDILDEEIKLYVGETKTFKVNGPTRVVIGNPAIVDINRVTDDTVVLTPKSAGVTVFAYSDATGEHSFSLRVLTEDLTSDLAQIKGILKGLSQANVNARLVSTEDKILLQGDVKTQDDKERILDSLAAFKNKFADFIRVREEETTVDIDVQVLEMNKDATKTLGFTLPSSVSATEPAGKYSTDLGKSMDAIFHVFDWGRSSFSARIDALVEEGKVRVLSRPRLACQSGKEAELLVGGEKPILTTQSSGIGATTTQVSYKEYGIKLKIKPTVTEENRIKVALNVEVSTIGDAEILGSPSAPTAKAYPLTKRSANTELFLNNGQTLGIGGLVREKEESDTKKTAFLGDIPILGMLFRNKTTRLGGGKGERGNIELVILLTPKIIPSQEKAAPRPRTGRSSGLSSAASSVASQEYSNIAVGDDGVPPSPSLIYADMVKDYILSNFKYPSFIKESGLQGTVKLTLDIASSGELLKVKVKQSSGHKVLDDYAVSIAKEIPSYPPFPSSIDSKDLLIDIPIVYKLD